MMNEFEISDFGLLSYFLGVEFEITKYETVMHQSKYAKDLLRRLNMQQSNSVEIPTKVGILLEKETNGIGTIGFGVLFPKGEAEEEPELIGYSDSNWCGDKSDRKNIVGYIFFYGGAPISWSFTKELVVALSSSEAEYIATFEIACLAIWPEALMKDLQVDNLGKIKLVDNKSAIDLARHLASHGRNKHIETRFHFLRKQVNNEKVQIEHCRTKIQFVDILTKALKLERFRWLRDSIGIVCVYATLN
ncbi:Copia protein, partial [Mucuna pruriens]